MNNHNKNIQDRLDAMPFIEARKAIIAGTIYVIGSPNYAVALSWLEGKEAELRDQREAKTHSFTLRSVRIDRIIAVVAIMIAIIAARKDIWSLISWLIDTIKKIH